VIQRLYRTSVVIIDLVYIVSEKKTATLIYVFHDKITDLTLTYLSTICNAE